MSGGWRNKTLTFGLSKGIPLAKGLDVTVDECIALVRDLFPGIAPDVTPSSKLVDDLCLCSYDIMVLVAAVEDRTDKRVDIVRFSTDVTVGGLVDSLAD